MIRLLIALSLLLATNAQAQVARFALVVGNNRGGERQSTLRYAERDAERFSRLLVDLGGFSPEQVHLLTGESSETFRETLTKIDEQIALLPSDQSRRTLLVVYFSGHADGVNLELGSDRLPFADLREAVEAGRADIKIAFVDSCQSGGLTASKGGTPGPSFDLVLSESLEVNGTAFVTSSSSREKSQESGELQGSFFTHFLLSGLRGTADQNQDRKVTLGEVYQYAYQKTVAETARTISGTQHPTYDYQIAGRGTVVLTDLARGEAQLGFGAEANGQFLVINEETEAILAELNKSDDTTRYLALPAGSYRVGHRQKDRFVSQRITLERGSTRMLDLAKMREETTLLAMAEKQGGRRSGIGVVLHYGLMNRALNKAAAAHQAIVGMRLDLGPLSLFPRFAYGSASVTEEPAFIIQLFSFESYVTWRFEYSVLDLFAGLNLGVSYGAQELEDARGEMNGTLFTVRAVGGIDVPVYDGLAVQLFWEGGTELFQLNESVSQNFSLRGTVGVGYEF